MRLSATGCASMTGRTPESALLEAFREAWWSFMETHGGVPNLDYLDIQGGFSTTTLVLEISEDT